MQRVFMLMVGLVWAGCTRPAPAPRSSSHDADAAFVQLADEYIAGYLAWRPQIGTSLGLHEYDGKVTDYSQASLGAELARLKSFDQRLGQLNTNYLSPKAFYDYRILRSAIQREVFGFEQMRIYSNNPMTYADVHVYQGGKYICTAYPVERSSMINDDLTSQKIAEKRARRAKFAEEFRKIS